MENLISIVIPVYNVELYLERCINSVINQTYSNIEILLIDDGSSDNSLNICNTFKQLDSRIKVCHKENGGLSSARNYGIDIAKGKWIYFLDSDDWIDKNTIEILLNCALEHGAKIAMGDLVFCETIEEFQNYKTEYEFEKYTSIEALKEMSSGKKFVFYACNRLFLKDLFYDIRFPLGKLYEDMYTIYKIVDKANVIIYNPTAKYAYFQRNNSLANSTFNIKQMDWYDALKEYRSYCSQIHPSLHEVINNYMVFACISLINKIIMTKDGLQANNGSFLVLYNEIKKCYRDYIFSRSSGLAVNLKYKLSVSLLLFSKTLYKSLIIMVYKN